MHTLWSFINAPCSMPVKIILAFRNWLMSMEEAWKKMAVQCFGSALTILTVLCYLILPLAKIRHRYHYYNYIFISEKE